ACSDMLGASLWMAAVALLVGRRRVGALVAGGACAGLAALTRYNLASVVPASLVLLATARVRGSAFAWWGAGCAVVLVPFTLDALASGHPPGAGLFHDASFYLSDAPQELLERRTGGLEAAPAAPTAAAPRNVVAAFATRALAGIPRHLVADARVLLGWPTAPLVLADVASLVAARRARLPPPFMPFTALRFPLPPPL